MLFLSVYGQFPIISGSYIGCVEKECIWVSERTEKGLKGTRIASEEQFYLVHVSAALFGPMCECVCVCADIHRFKHIHKLACPFEFYVFLLFSPLIYVPGQSGVGLGCSHGW